MDSDSSTFDRTLLVVFNCSIISFMNSPIGNTVPSLQVRVTSLTLLAEGAETGEDRSLIPFTRCVFTLIGLWIASSLGLFAGLTWAVVSWMALPSSKLSSTGMQSSSTSEHPSSSEFTLSKIKLRLGIIGHYYLMWTWEIFFVRESWSFQREALPRLQEERKAEDLHLPWRCISVSEYPALAIRVGIPARKEWLKFSCHQASGFHLLEVLAACSDIYQSITIYPLLS